MKKPDEILLMKTLIEETEKCVKHQKVIPYFRGVVNRLGINEKRAAYILYKYADKGFIDCGVSILAGWIELDKLDELKNIIEIG